MDFSVLVNYYEKISSTRKRLEILDILSDLFLKFKKDKNLNEDIEKVVYLTQGLIYPEIEEQPKLGLADKMLLEFISKYYTIDLKKANQILKKTGDLGATAEKISVMKKSKKSQLTSFMEIKEEKITISDIYNKLKEVSEISGTKSNEKKYNKLKWIFARCKPEMLKYIIRIINSSMRLGVSDPTIMDALAVAYLGERKYREEIERAYNLHPDLGKIARIAFEKGLEGIENVSVTVGIPIRMMLASRLNYTQIFSKLGGKEFISEYKLDGERLQIHKNKDKISIFSRQLKNITEMYPDVKEMIMNNIKAEKCIIEGEAVAMDPFYENMLPFQVLITRKRKYDVEQMVEKVNVRLYLFDILYIDRESGKKNVMDSPFLERRKLLKSIIEPSEQLQQVEGKLIYSTEDLVAFFNEAREKNCEGLMNKSIDPENSVYKAGNRGYLWIKLKSLEAGKMTDTLDVVPIGAKWGKGRRANRYGVLFMAVYNNENEKYEFLTQCGSGFSDENIEMFTEIFSKLKTSNKPNDVICNETPDIWFYPGIVMEIAGDELTISPKSDAGKFHEGKIRESGFSVRFPTFQRIRDDKGIDEITTVQELYDLYESQ